MRAVFTQKQDDDWHFLGALTVLPDESTEQEGELSWLDYDFAPFSSRLNRPVRFKDDPREWLRSLIDAYAKSETLRVELKDREPEVEVDKAPKLSMPVSLPKLSLPKPLLLGIAGVLVLLVIGIAVTQFRTDKAPPLVAAPVASEIEMQSLIPLAIDYAAPTGSFDSPANLAKALSTRAVFKVAAGPAKPTSQKTVFIETASPKGDLVMSSTNGKVKNTLTIPYGQAPSFVSK